MFQGNFRRVSLLATLPTLALLSACPFDPPAMSDAGDSDGVDSSGTEAVADADSVTTDEPAPMPTTTSGQGDDDPTTTGQGDDDPTTTGRDTQDDADPQTDGDTTTQSDTDTEGEAGEGPTDAPPEISQFDIDGSTTPAEVSSTRTVLLDVDVTDDVGIDRVEFYDDGELVATSTSSPYTAQVLLSSADNGAHTFTATAFDTAGQTDDADPVGQSVNIDGGSTITLLDALGDVEGSSFHGPTLIAHDDEILLIATVYSVEPETSGLRYIRYSEELGILSNQMLDSSSAGADRVRVTSSRPSLLDGDVLMAGVTSGASIQAAAYLLDPETADLESHGLEPSGPNSDVEIIADNTGAFIHIGPQSDVVKWANVGVPPLWTSSMSSGGQYASLAVNSDNEVLLSTDSTDCPGGADQCVRKFSSLGAVQWTVDMSDAGDDALLAVADDDTIAVVPRPGGELFLLDNDGTVQSMPLATPPGIEIGRIMFDPQGHLLVAGRTHAVQAVADGWVGRLDREGNVIWERDFVVGDESDVTGLEVTPEGRLYISGYHSIFFYDIAVHGAIGFIAELTL